MKLTSVLILFALTLAGCTVVVRDTPVDTKEDGTNPTVPAAATTATTNRECVSFTGGTAPVTTGSAAGDALFLSGELFRCANDVVVVADDDLNEVAAAAQLAAALGGPLLLPHEQLAAELGRLKPQRLHLIGEVEVQSPPGAELTSLTIDQAVELATDVLQVTVDKGLPATPDASTIVETVRAILERSYTVSPLTNAPPSTVALEIDEAAVVAGLAVPTGSESVWLVDAGDPLTLFVAAATGRSIGATVIPYDPDDVLGFPEVGDALGGRPIDSIRYVGVLPTAHQWELAVLANGVQVPGGGFHIFPDGVPRRYLAFYGHPTTAALGALGEQPAAETWSRMQPFLADYAGDGSQVVPAFEMIASVASAIETDGDYSFEWPTDTFEEYIRIAEENDAYVIFDLQPGRDHFLTQAKEYEELLKLPFVGLALDPEWRLKPDQVHLRQVGSVDAAELNEVVHWLADLVRDNGLPQKMIIVHQFRETMIRDRETLEQRPELQMIIQMDGDGTEAQKDDTYDVLTRGTEETHWKWGWKNFFDEDEPGPPTPESVMGKDPVPVYVSYQ